MTGDKMALLELLEKGADPDLIRDTLAFTSEWVMDAEVEVAARAPRCARLTATAIANGSNRCLGSTVRRGLVMRRSALARDAGGGVGRADCVGERSTERSIEHSARYGGGGGAGRAPPRLVGQGAHPHPHRGHGARRGGGACGAPLGRQHGATLHLAQSDAGAGRANCAEFRAGAGGCTGTHAGLISRRNAHRADRDRPAGWRSGPRRCRGGRRCVAAGAGRAVGSMIGLAPGRRIFLPCGYTDMRRYAACDVMRSVALGPAVMSGIS